MSPFSGSAKQITPYLVALRASSFTAVFYSPIFPPDVGLGLEESLTGTRMGLQLRNEIECFHLCTNWPAVQLLPFSFHLFILLPRDPHRKN